MLMEKELFGSLPDFNKWNEAELDKYINSEMLKYHKQNGINNHQDAVARLNWEFVQGFINADELELFLSYEKKFWDINE